MSRAVAYYRVSTKQQQSSGLGIEAQRAAVTRFVEAEGLAIITEFVEPKQGRARMRSSLRRLDRRVHVGGSVVPVRIGLGKPLVEPDLAPDRGGCRVMCGDFRNCHVR